MLLFQPTTRKLLTPLFVLVLFLVTWFSLKKTNFINHNLLNKNTTGKEEALGLGNDDDSGSPTKVLNVHIVPHTHDDVGWLKTVDQYYHGWNDTIQKANVSSILTTILTSLQQNPHRKFTYVEIAYFSQFYNHLPPSTRQLIHYLIHNTSQLSFANGGWCMHDEATTHFMGMMDQTTLGHDFLKYELNVIPTVGWQLDPFGHSSVQGGLMTRGLGFDSLFFGRVDHVDLKERWEGRRCEGMWDPNGDGDDDGGEVFWGLSGSYGGMYGPPPGFCFDPIGCGDKYQSLMNETEEGLIGRVELFLREMKVQADRTRGNNIMVTMGEDFQYEHASINFENLDILINSIERFQKQGTINVSSIFPNFDSVHAFYSTPEMYTRSKYQEFVHKPRSLFSSSSPEYYCEVKTDDFFPYSDCDNCYWSGYYTSRPSLKRLERVGSAFLQAARQVESLFLPLIRTDKQVSSSLLFSKAMRVLEEAMAVAQHHDAVSGTSKQHVAFDYAKRIQHGINAVERHVVDVLKGVVLSGDDDDDDDVLDNLSYCQLLNETVCEITQDATRSEGTDVYIIIYNPLANTHNRTEVIPIPVETNGTYIVEALDNTQEESFWKVVPSSLFPNLAKEEEDEKKSRFILHFVAADLPPVGMALFRIRLMEKIDDDVSQEEHGNEESSCCMEVSLNSSVSSDGADDEFVVYNGVFDVKFTGGTISKVTSRPSSPKQVNLSLSQQWGYYSSFRSESKSQQNSGAYIFRPQTPDVSILPINKAQTKIHISDFLTEVHTEYGGENSSWIKQITRLKYGTPHIELEWMVGPVPIEDGIGKEVVMRIDTDIHNGPTFYTDSNGLSFLERNASHHALISGNYYPVNTALYIKDKSSSLVVGVDRSQGGSSLRDGSVEFMVQRRILDDDARGVGEALNETEGGVNPYPPFGDARRVGEGVMIKGVHRLLFGEGEDGAGNARSIMERSFSQPLVFAASSPMSKKNPPSFCHQASSFSAMKHHMPQNTMLLTVSKRPSSSKNIMKLLIRLGHKYGQGESETLSKSVSVDLNDLFVGWKVVKVTEKTLSGNQDIVEWEKRRIRWRHVLCRDHFVDDSSSSRGGVDARRNLGGGIIRLNPLEIRTFEVEMLVEDLNSVLK